MTNNIVGKDVPSADGLTRVSMVAERQKPVRWALAARFGQFDLDPKLDFRQDGVKSGIAGG